MKKILVIIGLICLLAGIAILSILLVNCRGCPKGQYCRDECPNAGCPKGQYCRDECPNAGCPKGQSCKDESPECKACSGNLVCGPSQTCVQCTSNGQCTTSGKSQCNTENNTCVECMKDSNCAGVKKGVTHLSYCGSASQCHACIAGSQTPYRDCYNWNQFGQINGGKDYPSMKLDSSCVLPVGDCIGGLCALTSLQLGNSILTHCNSPLQAVVLIPDGTPPIWNLVRSGSDIEKAVKKLLPKPQYGSGPPHAVLFEYSGDVYNPTPTKYIQSYKPGAIIHAKDIKSNQSLFIFSTN
jgi:hypothetical protein